MTALLKGVRIGSSFGLAVDLENEKYIKMSVYFLIYIYVARLWNYTKRFDARAELFAVGVVIA